MGIQGKKVLLIQFSFLGEVIYNIPLANLLKEGGADVHWLISDELSDVIEGNPCSNKAILAPFKKCKKSKNLIKNLFEYIKTIKNLRKEQYDIIIDSQADFQSFLISVFLGGKRRIVPKSAPWFSTFFRCEAIEPLFRDLKLHSVYNYYKFAHFLGLDTTKISVTLPDTTDEIKRRVDNILYFARGEKSNLVIAPVSAQKNKNWDKENWKNLIKKFDLERYNVIFTGLRGDREFIDEIRGEIGHNLAGKTNLPELVEIFRRSNILISLDTGVAGLAWASLKPKILSIFCATPHEKYAPLGIQHIALSGHLLCQPCSKQKCPLKTNRCANFPDVDEVYDAFCELERGLK